MLVSRGSQRGKLSNFTFAGKPAQQVVTFNQDDCCEAVSIKRP